MSQKAKYPKAKFRSSSSPARIFSLHDDSAAMSKKTRVSKLWSKRNLPEELWPEILSRLPVKSLIRFRCVSRSWKILIDDPDFARAHLNRFNKPRESPLFFLQSSGECVVKNSKTLRTNCSIGFLQSDRESINVLRTTPADDGQFRIRWAIVSYIDGLFTLICETRPVCSDLMLWNPSIRKTLLLPPFPELPFYHKNVDFGLGFDPSIKNYKLVRFGVTPGGGMKFVALYTLGTNSWKMIEFQGEEERQDVFLQYGRRPISFNGALYALARDHGLIGQHFSPTKLVSFDLRSEVFASTGLPVDCSESLILLTMVDDGCSLAVVFLTRPKGSMWTLEMSGDDIKSWNWIQRYTFVLGPKYDDWNMKFLGLKKNGEMLFQWHKMVVCYNPETQQEKIMLEKNKKTFRQENIMPYIESLILHH